jgi:acetyl-CoA carboxylase carboxyltransferase component
MFADDINESDDKKAAIKDAAAKVTEAQAGAAAVAKRGYVDDIIEPDATRKRLIAAFDMLATKSEDRPYKKHMAF